MLLGAARTSRSNGGMVRGGPSCHYGHGGGCSTMTAAATKSAPIGNGFIIDRLTGPTH